MIGYLLVITSALALSKAEVEVSTSLGVLRGIRVGPVEEFLGVRFAQNPERFALANVDTQAWSGVRNATKQHKACWQPTSFPCISSPKNASVDCNYPNAAQLFDEDCLFLDIYRPAHTGKDGRGLKPVMVWIHGGGMTVGGSGTSNYQNGTIIAHRQDIILVCISYRLGPLGFFPVKKFGDPGHGSGTMNGQHDQIVALKWLQSHISSFGGDPNRVTIAGASSGGLSVCTLTVSPLAAGLFHQAIFESGPCIGPWAPGTQKEALDVADRMMATLGVKTVEELKALHPSKLLWGQGEDQYDIQFPGYWVDGWVAPEQPGIRMRKGLWNPKAVLLGATSRDGMVFNEYNDTGYISMENFPNATEQYMPLMKQRWRPRNVTGGLYNAIRTSPGLIGEMVAQAYPVSRFEDGGYVGGAFKAADGDYNVVCPARRIARVASESRIQTYLYYFEQGPWLTRKLGCRLKYFWNNAHSWATHATETYWVFSVFNVDGCDMEQPEKKLSETVQTLWANFVKFGEPSHGHKSPTWTLYTSGGAAMRLEVDHLEMIPDFGTATHNTVNCTFWEEVTGHYGVPDNIGTSLTI